MLNKKIKDALSGHGYRKYLASILHECSFNEQTNGVRF